MKRACRGTPFWLCELCDIPRRNNIILLKTNLFIKPQCGSVVRGHRQVQLRAGTAGQQCHSQVKAPSTKLRQYADGGKLVVVELSHAEGDVVFIQSKKCLLMEQINALDLFSVIKGCAGDRGKAFVVNIDIDAVIVLLNGHQLYGGAFWQVRFLNGQVQNIVGMLQRQGLGRIPAGDEAFFRTAGTAECGAFRDHQTEIFGNHGLQKDVCLLGIGDFPQNQGGGASLGQKHGDVVHNYHR